jgi:hypothetical protein
MKLVIQKLVQRLRMSSTPARKLGGDEGSMLFGGGEILKTLPVYCSRVGHTEIMSCKKQTLQGQIGRITGR